MTGFVYLVAGLILIFFSPAKTFSYSLIQRIEIPSSVSPVGSGARALGMGGAFIAVAHDAAAASWNPGGLTQLGRSEISVVGLTYAAQATREHLDFSQDVDEHTLYSSMIVHF